MDDPVTNTNEPLDIEPAASSSRDRSDGSYRFIDALQTARRQIERDPGPPVELHLSQRAQEYARQLDGDGSPREKKRREHRHDQYPPRAHGPHEPQTPGTTDRDGSNDHD
jgi:hypothetical protein